MNTQSYNNIANQLLAAGFKKTRHVRGHSAYDTWTKKLAHKIKFQIEDLDPENKHNFSTGYLLVSMNDREYLIIKRYSTITSFIKGINNTHVQIG